MNCQEFPLTITSLLSELNKVIKEDRNANLTEISIDDFLTLLVSYWSFNNPHRDSEYVIQQLKTLIERK